MKRAIKNIEYFADKDGKLCKNEISIFMEIIDDCEIIGCLKDGTKSLRSKGVLR